MNEDFIIVKGGNRTGVMEDLILGNRLIVMYNKCRRVVDARLVFDKLTTRNVISWNAMIGGYAKHGYGKEAFRLFQQMQRQGIKPDNVTFISILGACTCSGALAYGKIVHAHIVERGVESDAFVGNAIVHMYGKCGSIDDAGIVFNRMPKHDVVSWNTIIAVYAQHGYVKNAFRVFEQMQHEVIKVDKITFINILNACSSSESLAQGKLLHAHIVNLGFEADVVVGTALVNMYVKCGRIEDAHRMFHSMSERNVVSWNAIIGGYACLEYSEEAVRAFHQMERDGLKPDKVTFICILNACVNQEALALGKLIHARIVGRRVEHDTIMGNALVNMYGKCGSICDARRMFDRMTVRDVISWTAMMDVYSRHGHGDEAFELFKQMQQERVEPDKVTFIAILNGCVSPEALHLGKTIHSLIVDEGFELDVVVGTALVNMYGKCGSIRDAHAMFHRMPSRNVISWNAMIAAYAQHGYGVEAIEHFQHMQQEGMNPDDITLTNVLNACTHAGLVEEGIQFFNSMSQCYGITPAIEHFNCMVNLLGRAGQLDEAETFIDTMPIQPDALTWMTFLGSCRIYGCIERAKCAAERAIRLDPQLSSAYVVLSNIYASVGRWDDASKVRKLMADRDVRKEIGCSWIAVNNRVHKFVVRDRSHPQTQQIYAELERLNRLMKDAGYVPSTDFVLHDVEDEQKEHLIYHHSEKLAIGFGLISTSGRTPLLITKNLRVCIDCHTVAKFISKIVAREIIMRDSSRFHHLKDGMCSCGDFW